jgi:hypothetical protein
MNINELTKHFASMGARLKVNQSNETAGWRRGGATAPLNIDIRSDRRGEYFDIAVADEAPEVQLLQATPKERHLLLYTNDGQRFLCGHDERHWFVAAIAEPVSTVRAAKQSLMPEAVRQQAKNLPAAKIDNRKNDVFLRQGEWFFVPAEIDVSENLVLRNEPLQRTPRSKPHIVQELYRQGGETVYIVGGRAYNEREFRRLRQRIPDVDVRPSRTMVRNPAVYARGTVRHADHATIRLDGWHQVFLNGERASSAVSFLD